MKTFAKSVALALAAALGIAGCTGGGGSGAGGGASAATGAGASGGSTGGSSGGSTGASTGGSTGASAFPIDHVFILFKENHTYDNYFASFPGGDGSLTGIDSKGKTVRLEYPASDRWIGGSNDWDPAHAAWDGGRMDRFDAMGGFPPVPFDHAAYKTYAPDAQGASAMVHYYWGLAERGVLCDRFFTSVMGPSNPNHMFIACATSGNLVTNGDLITGENTFVNPVTGLRYRRPGSQTFSVAEIPTALPVELEKKGLTWAAYIEEYHGSLSVIPQIGVLDSSIPFENTDCIHDLPDYA
ncbi:MAG TPA: alkaline phosphatase family protein, partial [Planctomycetota bacterium]|nr:alkaline phosphatase family protein [Planctomycetota bacterium]